MTHGTSAGTPGTSAFGIVGQPWVYGYVPSAQDWLTLAVSKVDGTRQVAGLPLSNDIPAASLANSLAGTGPGTLAAGNDARITGALQSSAVGPLATVAGSSPAAAVISALSFIPITAAQAPVQSVAGLTGAPTGSQIASALPTASTSVPGLVKVDGSTIAMNNGIASVPSNAFDPPGAAAAVAARTVAGQPLTGNISAASLASALPTASTSGPGLVPTLTGSTSTYLRSDGTQAVPPTGVAANPGGSSGQIQVNASSAFGGVTPSGDVVSFNAGTGAFTIGSIGGKAVSLAAPLTTTGTGGVTFAGPASALTLTLPTTSSTLAATSQLPTIPSATATQLYAGTGAAGAITPVSLGTNLSLTSGTLNATGGSGATIPSATPAQIYVGTGSANSAAAQTISGDATLATSGALTVTKLNGQSVALGGALSTTNAVAFAAPSGGGSYTLPATGATLVSASNTIAGLQLGTNPTARQVAGTVQNQATIASSTTTVGTSVTTVFPSASSGYISVSIGVPSSGSEISCTANGSTPTLGTSATAYPNQLLLWPTQTGGSVPMGPYQCIASASTTITTEAH